MEYINFEHNETAAELVRAAYDTPPLAFVHSYGCQQNVNDGERIKGVLVDIGYGLCDKPEDADLILFNTCAVREHAEQRVFGNVGALKGLKEKKRGLMIGLCGCMANQRININVNFTEFPGDGTASWVLPFADYMDIDDAAVYPVEFVSMAIVPGDAAKATGHIDLPGIEVLYTGDLGGVENVTVNAAGGPEGWYTIQGVSLPGRPTAPGLYIHRTATYTAKVAIR